MLATREQCNISVTLESPKNVEIRFWDILKSRLEGMFAATQMAYMVQHKKGVIVKAFGLSFVHPEVLTTFVSTVLG